MYKGTYTVTCTTGVNVPQVLLGSVMELHVMLIPPSCSAVVSGDVYWHDLETGLLVALSFV